YWSSDVCSSDLAAIDQEMHYNQNPSSSVINKAPHFVEYVKNMLDEEYGEDRVNRSGFKVYTTLDVSLQTSAQEQVKAQVAQLQGSGANNGALVALDPNNGEMLAMVGSADYSNDEIQGKFNFATGAQQPGSTTKPFAYLRSFEEGYTPATILHDKLTDFGGGYKPQNADRRFRGDVTVRRALANSLNEIGRAHV